MTPREIQFREQVRRILRVFRQLDAPAQLTAVVALESIADIVINGRDVDPETILPNEY